MSATVPMAPLATAPETGWLGSGSSGSSVGSAVGSATEVLVRVVFGGGVTVALDEAVAEWVGVVVVQSLVGSAVG